MHSGISTYLESGVMSADPVELLRMLYRGAIDAVEKARQYLRAGDIGGRSAQITKAGAIVAHLAFSINPDADPAMGRNLVELYDYIQRRLVRANLEQSDGPLAEVLQLLETLLASWSTSGPAATVRPEVHAEAEPAQAAPAGANGGHAEAAPAEWPPAGMYGGYSRTEPAAWTPAGADGGYAEAVPAAQPPAPAYSGYTEAAPSAWTPAGAYGGYSEAVPAERPPAAAYGGYTEAAPSAWTPAGAYGGYSQAVPADRTPAGAYGGYSETVPAEQTPAGAYGGYPEPEAEPEVEYAGKSWNF
jgi:flagellar protein FliS